MTKVTPPGASHLGCRSKAIRLLLAALAFSFVLPTGPALAAGINPRAGQAQAAAPAALTLALEAATLHVGECTTIEVRAASLPPLAGLSLSLHLDTSRLRAVSVAPGDLLASAFAERRNAIDNQSGNITYVAYSASSPWPSGSGCLLRITVQALASGEAAVSIRAPATVLVSPDGLQVGYTPASARLTVLEALDCGNRLPNPGFEGASLGPWTRSGLAEVTHLQAHEGSAGAWLGGYNYWPGCTQDRLSQSLTLGSEPGTASLSYWCYIQTDEGETAADRLIVELLSPSSQPLLRHELTNLDAAPVWRRFTVGEIDLQPYAGQTVRLVLRSTGDGNRVTGFFVDDLALEMCGTVETPAMSSRVYLPLVLSP